MASIWLFLQQAALPGKSKQRLSTNPLCPQRHLPLDYRIWEKNIKTQWILKKKEIRAKKVRRRSWRQVLGEAELFGRTYTALRQREGSKDKWWPKNGLSLPTWSLLNPLADSNQRLSATLVVVSDNWWTQASYYWGSFFPVEVPSVTWPLTVRGHGKPQAFSFPPAWGSVGIGQVALRREAPTPALPFLWISPELSCCNASQSSSFNEPCNWWKWAQSGQIISSHCREPSGEL